MLVEEGIKCYHCGLSCDDKLKIEDKYFCCFGCKTIFEIISDNDLGHYYSIENHPGARVAYNNDFDFSYLDDTQIREKILEFDSQQHSKVQFSIPSIHCTSCIWLLENLPKTNGGIVHSEVNFSKKTVRVDFNPAKTKLSTVAKVLANLGYAPRINLESADSTGQKLQDHSLILKLALAGFCFGNIMLLSFPEYLGLDNSDKLWSSFFSRLNVVLSLPVLLYCDRDYFRSAWSSFRNKQINIDVPIVIGLICLSFRSYWDILFGVGPGYLDSFSGLVFFLLIGRWFQSKTYESLAFDRDYKSYFPLAVNRRVGHSWLPTILYNLRTGDEIKIRNMEIVPADSTLLNNEATIDYSFVTGESQPVKVEKGNLVFAGGRLMGSPAIFCVAKNISNSHLTSLWNNPSFQKKESLKSKKIIDKASTRFTWVILVIALLTGVYWFFANSGQMLLVVTSVLMVACPCALALSVPFTYGSMLRAFGGANLYCKNFDVIEKIASVTDIVFDKTGTITFGKKPKVDFEGSLTKEEMAAVKLLTSYSSHPLSIIVHNEIEDESKEKVVAFQEIPGKGIEGSIGGHFYRVGSAFFISPTLSESKNANSVYVSVNGQQRGIFIIQISIRPQVKEMVERLGNRCTALLSGDNDADLATMQNLFHGHTKFMFNQNPHQKMEFIRGLQNQNKTVMMIGDGLNDSGALNQSDVGISIVDSTAVFNPACDGILLGDNLGKLDSFIALTKSAQTIVKIAFAISLLYNSVAVGIAVLGYLTPLIATILMPLSSISVVVFTTLSVNLIAKRKLTN